MSERTSRSDQAATPPGWDPVAWKRADAAARRAIKADQLARQSHPPAKVGFEAFNRARGEIMDRLDREAADE